MTSLVRQWVTPDGEVIELGEGLPALLADRIEELESSLRDIERERRGERARVRFLLAQIEDDRRNYDRLEELHEIFCEWQGICNHQKARLTNDRFDAIRGILEVTKPEPYPREAFTKAFLGGAFDPYISRRKNGTWKRHDDISLICRDGKTFEDFVKRAPKEEGER